MPELEDKLVEAVAALIKLTQENKIAWSSSEPPGNLNSDEDVYVGTVFLGTHNKRILRLYERETKVRFNPLLSAFASQDSSWKAEVILEILDSANNMIWTFPTLTPLKDLLASVRYQVADVNDFIEDLLKDSDKETD
jgi:hypothetical protein